MGLILTNGKIYTMDGERSIEDSIYIKDKKIYRVGNGHELLKLKNDNTEVIDLQGKAVVPGFNDSHMHLVNYGYTRTQVDLIGVKSIEDISHRILKYMKDKELANSKWILGRGWNQDYFTGEKKFPNRYDLDNISMTHPILITRICGHVAVANSKALELFGIHRDTPQFQGGYFDLDGKGEPLGIFREQALGQIHSYLPSPSITEIKEMILSAVEDLNRYGITSVGSDDFEALPNKDYDNIIRAYMELKKEGKLNIRVYEQCLLPQLDRLKEFNNKGYKTGQGDEHFKIGPLKLLIDGSLGARTAALNQPYSDDNTTSGITTINQEGLDKIVAYAHKNENQLAIHGIGDRAMYMAIESIEKILGNNQRDHRHGIVHCQITDEYLLNKFKELNILAYIQPIFLDYDWKIVKNRVGEERERTSYNWKTMIHKGINISCGSDAPVEDFNVMKGIYEAVTRKDLEGNPKEGWLPGQALTVDEALYGYTMGGAYASFEENIKGSIEEGKLADLVILTEDIFEINPDKIKDVKVAGLIFDGKLMENIV